MVLRATDEPNHLDFSLRCCAGRVLCPRATAQHSFRSGLRKRGEVS